MENIIDTGKRKFNKFYPIIFSFLGTTFFIYTLYFLRDKALNKTLNLSSDILSVILALAASILTFEGIIIGFLITSQSILAAIDNKEIIKWHKKAGTYKKINFGFSNAIRWSFLSALMTIISFIIVLIVLESKTFGNIEFVILSFWAFSTLMSFLLSYKLAISFSRILNTE
jgi:hypothetical protein